MSMSLFPQYSSTPNSSTSTVIFSSLGIFILRNTHTGHRPTGAHVCARQKVEVYYANTKCAMTSAEPARTTAYSTDIGWRVVWHRIGMGLTYKEIVICLQIGVGTAHACMRNTLMLLHKNNLNALTQGNLTIHMNCLLLFSYMRTQPSISMKSVLKVTGVA